MPAIPLSIPNPRGDRERRAGAPMRLRHLLPEPVYFVMAGGGAHGAVQWGGLQAIDHTDIVPAAIVGNSAGAMTGAIVAEDLASAVHRVAYVWAQLDLRDLTGDKWFSRRTLASARQAGLLSNDAERASLEMLLDARDFDDLEIPFHVVATDLATGRPTVFSTGELIPTLLASSAIPGVLPPVEVGGRLYVDGLASANLPAIPAVELGAGSLIVFDTGSRKANDVSVSAAGVLGRVAGIMAASQRRRQLRDAAHSIPVVVLPTPNDLGGSLSFKDTIRGGASGYTMARSFLADLAAVEEPLRPGLYARPDDHSVAAELAEVVREVKES